MSRLVQAELIIALWGSQSKERPLLAASLGAMLMDVADHSLLAQARHISKLLYATKRGVLAAQGLMDGLELLTFPDQKPGESSEDYATRMKNGMHAVELSKSRRMEAQK